MNDVDIMYKDKNGKNNNLVIDFRSRVVTFHTTIKDPDYRDNVKSNVYVKDYIANIDFAEDDTEIYIYCVNTTVLMTLFIPDLEKRKMVFDRIVEWLDT